MYHAVISSTFNAKLLDQSQSTVRLFFIMRFLNMSVRISKVSKRESPLSSACKFAFLNVLVRFSLTTLHARQVALCHQLLSSITSGPGHKLSTLLPLKRNFRYSLGPTPRAITNFLKNYFIRSMCFFCFCVCFCFHFKSRGGIIISGATTRQDTDQGFTEPYLACTVGLLALAKVVTTDSGGRERPTCRGRLGASQSYPSPNKNNINNNKNNKYYYSDNCYYHYRYLYHHHYRYCYCYYYLYYLLIFYCGSCSYGSNFKISC